jgi:hypothetical protein
MDCGSGPRSKRRTRLLRCEGQIGTANGCRTRRLGNFSVKGNQLGQGYGRVAKCFLRVVRIQRRCQYSSHMQSGHVPPPHAAYLPPHTLKLTCTGFESTKIWCSDLTCLDSSLLPKVYLGTSSESHGNIKRDTVAAKMFGRIS